MFHYPGFPGCFPLSHISLQSVQLTGFLNRCPNPGRPYGSPGDPSGLLSEHPPPLLHCPVAGTLRRASAGRQGPHRALKAVGLMGGSGRGSSTMSALQKYHPALVVRSGGSSGTEALPGQHAKGEEDGMEGICWDPEQRKEEREARETKGAGRGWY